MKDNDHVLRNTAQGGSNERRDATLCDVKNSPSEIFERYAKLETAGVGVC